MPTLKECFIQAADDFTSGCLPADYDTWDTNKLHEWIKENSWAPLEDYTPEDVLQFIQYSAESWFDFIKKCNETEE